jgi:hypothetical protein
MGTFFLLFTFDDPETTCPSAAGKLPDHFHLLLASQAVPLDSRSPPLYVLCRWMTSHLHWHKNSQSWYRNRHAIWKHSEGEAGR